MGDEVAAAFDGLGCEVGLLVQPLHGPGEVAVAAEQPVVTASVFKVLVALVVESRFAQRHLDPRQRVILRAALRTPGPVGFSLFADDVQVSLRDLVTAMLTISDNVATDTLIERVGVQTLNATAVELGLDHTHVVSDLHTMLDSIGHDAGFGDYATLAAWEPGHPEDPALAEVQQRVRTSTALDPAHTTRTTPRDMVRLLRGIWTDQAGPAQACARVRDLMAHQLPGTGSHPGSTPRYESPREAADCSGSSATRSASSTTPTAAPTWRRSSPAPARRTVAKSRSTRLSALQSPQPSPHYATRKLAACRTTLATTPQRQGCACRAVNQLPGQAAGSPRRGGGCMLRAGAFAADLPA